MRVYMSIAIVVIAIEFGLIAMIWLHIGIAIEFVAWCYRSMSNG